jgi:16S rRNA pseudouridine516 synthase
VKGAPSLRLDRLLANLGYGSRREVQQLVRLGAVKLDGTLVGDAEMKVALTPDLSARMRVQGKRLDPPPGVALMLHKPLGVTCSHKEVGELVYDLLPPRWQLRDPAISTVGRLDKETSGLLLLTDDGTLLHKIIAPKSQVTKRYEAELDRPLTGEEAATFASGTLMLDGEDKPLLPVPLEVLGPNRARVTLTEGRYHQVRRMFAAVGNHVTALHRDRVGALALPEDLAPGQYRIMTPQDLALVFGGNAAG